MIDKYAALLKSFLYVPLPDEYQKELANDINKINITRGKYTASLFIFIEAMTLIFSYMINKNNMFKGRSLYYVHMYFLMIITMIIFLLIFIKLEKSIPEHSKSITITGIIFTNFILCWCGGISLLDQMSSGQIIVYITAIISVAVTPILRPSILFPIYICVQSAFIYLIYYFYKYSSSSFANSVNSTTFIIISLAIAHMRYKQYIIEFIDKKIIQEKSIKLKEMNEKLEEANKKLKKFSQTDGLTGICNRFMFDKTINMEWDICKRQFKPLSLIMIDIDYFKAYNDSYGHQAGDDCLRQVAFALSICAKRSSDTVARYGGEEFAVILPCTEKEGAFTLAEQIRKEVESLAIPHAGSLVSNNVTISLGVDTITPSYMTSVKELISGADKALYDAKLLRNKTVTA